MFTILANPSKFQKLSEFIFTKSIFLFLLFFITGIYYSFFNSPPDYLQGETVRIMYVHVRVPGFPFQYILLWPFVASSQLYLNIHCRYY